MFYVYVLCCRDGSLYTGYTNDLKKRLRMHNLGTAAKYTRSRLPVKMVAKRPFATKSEAMKYEAAFKKLSRKAKMKKMPRLQSITSR
jgi:putative endonuclease